MPKIFITQTVSHLLVEIEGNCFGKNASFLKIEFQSFFCFREVGVLTSTHVTASKLERFLPSPFVVAQKHMFNIGLLEIHRLQSNSMNGRQNCTWNLNLMMVFVSTQLQPMMWNLLLIFG